MYIIQDLIEYLLTCFRALAQYNGQLGPMQAELNQFPEGSGHLPENIVQQLYKLKGELSGMRKERKKNESLLASYATSDVRIKKNCFVSLLLSLQV